MTSSSVVDADEEHHLDVGAHVVLQIRPFLPVRSISMRLTEISISARPFLR
jgi:hypothetical protein